MDAIRATRCLISALPRLRKLEGEREVLEDGLVRIEGVVLEHHRDVPITRGKAVDDLVPDPDRPVRDPLETRNHAERRRLPAAGWPDEHHQLTVGDLERQVDHGNRSVGVDLLDVLERDGSHASATYTMAYHSCIMTGMLYDVGSHS